MTNDDVVADLKQFIAATVSQATADMATKAEVSGLKADISGLKADLNELRQDVRELDIKRDDVQTAISDALTTNNDVMDGQLADHERRLSRLEHRRAV